MSEIKVGDKVKVVSLKSWKDERYLKVGEKYTVTRVDNDGWPIIMTDGVTHNMMPSQVEKVEDEEFTFPEMAQKLIDGEFEEGTELIAFRKSSIAGNILANYFVGVNGTDNYGLKEKTDSAFISTSLGASDFNATWKVKEQPIKEMSIEEIQKELGYKIKVTE